MDIFRTVADNTRLWTPLLTSFTLCCLNVLISLFLKTFPCGSVKPFMDPILIRIVCWPLVIESSLLLSHLIIYSVLGVTTCLKICLVGFIQNCSGGVIRVFKVFLTLPSLSVSNQVTIRSGGRSSYSC